MLVVDGSSGQSFKASRLTVAVNCSTRSLRETDRQLEMPRALSFKLLKEYLDTGNIGGITTYEVNLLEYIETIDYVLRVYPEMLGKFLWRLTAVLYARVLCYRSYVALTRCEVDRIQAICRKHPDLRDLSRLLDFITTSILCPQGIVILTNKPTLLRVPAGLILS